MDLNYVCMYLRIQISIYFDTASYDKQFFFANQLMSTCHIETKACSDNIFSN